MKYVKIMDLKAKIPIFDTEDLCENCSYIKDEKGCHSCNIFFINSLTTGGNDYFDRIFSVGEYHTKRDKNPKYNLSKLILRFKEDKKFVPYCVELLGKKILEALQEMEVSKNNALICPVPDEEDKNYQKGTLLASELSKKIGIPHSQLLKKIKTTEKQHKIHSIKKKFKNVKGAFQMNKKNFINLNDVVILLIDDIVSSRASVNECSRILKDKGVNKIFVFSIGRTILPKEKTKKEEK